MALKDFLNNIRTKENVTLTMKKKVAQVLCFFVLGLILGFLAKYFDGAYSSTGIGNLLKMLDDISSGIGIWIVAATIIASWSRTPKAGAIHVFVFFIGMLLSYYVYSMKLFGFFPTYYFCRWGLIALLSLLGAYIVWFSRGQGWIAALCASLPIGVLCAKGYSFLYTFAVVQGFNLFAAVVLLFVLPAKKYQRLKVLPLVLVITFLLRKFDILSYFIGGL